ncbi:MAG: hypothetical protein KF708_23930 [Pirellulales bacterium]|nr:hypothetical protein [Pirellulales bacterium]
MKRRRLLLSLLLSFSLGFGPASACSSKASAAENANRISSCITSSGLACQSLLQWATFASNAAAKFIQRAEEEAACRASIHQQAAQRPREPRSIDAVAYGLPSWVTFGLVQPRVAKDDGLPWVGPLSNNPARSADLSFAYAAHSWLSIGEREVDDRGTGEQIVAAAARSAQRAWTRNLSRLAADPRHSTGTEEVVAINSQHEGLQPQPKAKVTDEQVLHWFEEYTLGHELMPRDMITGLESLAPARRPAAIASLDDEVVAALTDDEIASRVEIDGFETVLDGPGRYLFLRDASRSTAAIEPGHVADIACRDDAELAAKSREREKRANAQALITAAASAINQYGTTLIGLSQQLHALANDVAEEREEQQVPVRVERHDAADARGDYRVWSGCTEWDIEAGVSSTPYLGL